MKPGKRNPQNANPVLIGTILRGGDFSIINNKLKAWVNAVNNGDEVHATELYYEIRIMYDVGDRPDWKAAGLPGPSGFFGWAARNQRSLKPKARMPVRLADNEVLYKTGPKKLPASTFPGFKGEPSRLPGMKKG